MTAEGSTMLEENSRSPTGIEPIDSVRKTAETVTGKTDRGPSNTPLKITGSVKR
jgi:hypothetical protein